MMEKVNSEAGFSGRLTGGALWSEPTRTIRPLGDRIVVRPAESASVTPGGLHVPDMAKEKPVEGVVTAVGDGVEGTLVIGDTVLYGRYAGTEVEIDGVPVLVLREADCIGVVE